MFLKAGGGLAAALPAGLMAGISRPSTIIKKRRQSAEAVRLREIAAKYGGEFGGPDVIDLQTTGSASGSRS